MKTIAIVLLTLYGWITAPLVAGSSNPPNVLFFLTDDESWLERSAYGWSNLPTPAFDRIARNGVLFTKGYTSAPSCGPSRAAFLTGRNFWELKEGAFIQGYVPKEFPVITDLLEEAGYVIGRTGKGWGPGIFPEEIAHPEKMSGVEINQKKMAYTPTKISDSDMTQYTPVMSDTDYAANFDLFLKQNEAGKPFFFWAGTDEPHWDWSPDNHKRLELEFGISYKDIPLTPIMEQTEKYRKERANFIYEICYADLQLQRMLQSLALSDQLANTLIIVTSDNGSWMPNGKTSQYNNGVHVPLAMMWADAIPRGRTITDFVNVTDLGPTILEAAGVEVPGSMTGRSILPTLKSDRSGRVEEDRNFVVTGLEWHGEFDPESRSHRALRDDHYEYIEGYLNVDEQGAPLTDGSDTTAVNVELYDLVNDPWQQTNLVDYPAYQAVKIRMAEQMRHVMKESGDPRATGETGLFHATRKFVQDRKRAGYPDNLPLPR